MKPSLGAAPELKGTQMRWRERKLHILLGEGLAALAKCEKDTENYTIDMSDWAFTQNGKCSVCLAGARFPKKMHQQGGWHGLFRLPENAQKAALALDFLRCGEISLAAEKLQLREWETPNRRVAVYELDKKQWWKDMRKLKAELKRRNK